MLRYDETIHSVEQIFYHFVNWSIFPYSHFEADVRSKNSNQTTQFNIKNSFLDTIILSKRSS